MDEELRSREATIDDLEKQLQRARAEDQRDKLQVMNICSVRKISTAKIGTDR